jgi:protein-S-isoprenylcysteine O-methyltransferase Ste14
MIMCVRNPIYLGSVVSGSGMVLLIDQGQLVLILAGILVVFRTVAGLRSPNRAK